MLINLSNSKFVAIFTCLVSVTCVRNEETLFKIRKCCAENELILESTGQCSENKLLKVKNHIYLMNDSGHGMTENGHDDSWPWWFPPDTKIISRKSGLLLSRFPSEYQLISGKGQPCKESETSYLPAYFYKYMFYDDGSILIHPTDEDQYRVISKKIEFDPLSFCIDRLDSDINLSKEENLEPVLEISDTIDYVVMLCPCTKATCILKCCQPGMVFDTRNKEVHLDPCIRNDRDHWVPIYSEEDDQSPDYFLLHRLPECKPGESLVLPNYSNGNGSEYVIFSNGTARIVGENYVSQPLEFCGDNIIANSDKKAHNRILRCFPRSGVKSWWSEVRRILYGWLFVIGAIFLLLTLVIHSCLPPMKKLNDKSLISQTWSLLGGYVSIAISQLAVGSLSQGVCMFLGFLIQYCFLSAFFWLNVLCIDISYTFSTLRIARGKYTEHTSKRRIFYFIHGWICPAVIVFVTAVIEFYPGIPDYLLKPEFKDRCWFKSRSLAQLAYFYGPIASLLAINLILFFYTSCKITRAQQDISSTIKIKNIEKKRFFLYVKLFILMGLSWTTELISWAVGGPEYFWFIPDSVNLLRALYIFVIICSKKQVLEELKKKFHIKKESNVRRPSNTRSSSVLGFSQIGESYRFSNNADSSL